MTTHSSIPAWKILWTEEPGGLQSMWSQESNKAKRLNHNHQPSLPETHQYSNNRCYKEIRDILVRRCSIQFRHSVVPDSLWSRGLQPTRLPCPSPTRELAQNHVYRVGYAIHLILWHPLLLLPSILLPASRFFPMCQFLASDGQSTGVSVSVSVLPMNIQDWFPLGLTSLIWQSKGLPRIFSTTTVQKHQFFSAQLSLWKAYGRRC